MRNLVQALLVTLGCVTVTSASANEGQEVSTEVVSGEGSTVNPGRCFNVTEEVFECGECTVETPKA